MFQGQWGTSSSEESKEEILKRRFVDEKVASLRSEFVVLHDSFKVCVKHIYILLYLHYNLA